MYFQPRSSLFGAGGEVPGWAFGITLASVAGLIGISLRKIERQYKAGHLSVVKGKASKTELDIISTVSLGRDERNSLGLFRDSAVEQYHAEVRRENGKYVIEDKGSASGTFVNDNKISRAHALADGDIISIGGARIVFSEESRGACAGCGGAVRANAKFCPKCGAKQL